MKSHFWWKCTVPQKIIFFRLLRFLFILTLGASKACGLIPHTRPRATVLPLNQKHGGTALLSYLGLISILCLNNFCFVSILFHALCLHSTSNRTTAKNVVTKKN